MRLRHVLGLLFGLLLGAGFVRFHIAHNHPQSHRQQIKGDHTLARRQHNRHGSPISVGTCSPWDETELASYTADKTFATALVDLALPNKWVRWVNLTGDGLPLTDDLPFPDIIFCLSGSYAHSALMTRIVKPPEFGLPIGVRSEDTDTWVDGVHYPDDMSFIKHTRGRPLLVGLNTDPWNRGDCQNLDVMLDTKLGHPYYGCPSLYLPYALLNLISAGFDLERTMAMMRTSTTSLEDISERNFCVLLCNPCRAHPMAGDGLILWAFLSILEEKYKKCDIIGDCQREAEVPQMCTPGQRNNTYVHALKTYSKYRFVVSFETAQVEGWFSEHIVLAAAAGSIPIFWGDEGIGGRLNEKRIFNMNDYISEEHVLKLRDAESMDASAKEEFAVNFLRTDMNKAINVVRGLNENIGAFQKVASLPLAEMTPSSSSSAMQLETVAKSFRSLLQHLDSFTIYDD